MKGKIGERPMVGGRALIPQGRGFILPPPLTAPVVSDHDRALRRKLVGAFEPGVGFAIVNEGQLCYDQKGQAHIYAHPGQCGEVLQALGHPPGYDIVQVVTADRTRCAQVMV